ncbi:uncharacterized protein VTP21DRAFT_2951 [Calcarisporiella thermophila]|uniref:uncharacterized protein n=1 Tax=Calcarisporiella thermophila TaxID=911321 RepID=UPI003742A2FC
MEHPAQQPARCSRSVGLAPTAQRSTILLGDLGRKKESGQDGRQPVSPSRYKAKIILRPQNFRFPPNASQSSQKRARFMALVQGLFWLESRRRNARLAPSIPVSPSTSVGRPPQDAFSRRGPETFTHGCMNVGTSAQSSLSLIEGLDFRMCKPTESQPGFGKPHALLENGGLLEALYHDIEGSGGTPLHPSGVGNEVALAGVAHTSNDLILSAMTQWWRHGMVIATTRDETQG